MSESLIVRALLAASAVQAHMFGQILRGEPTSYPPWCCRCDRGHGGSNPAPTGLCPVHERKPYE